MDFLVSLNNHAISAFQAGNPTNALFMLRGILQEVLQQQARIEGGQSSRQSHPNTFGRYDATSGVLIKETALMLVHAEAENFASGGASVLFNQAFLIEGEFPPLSPEHDADGFQMMQRLNITVAVVLYNLALGIHRIGWERGRSHMLQNAVHLYRKAISLMLQGSLPESCIDPRSLQLLRLALFNNMAHIQSLLFNRTEAARYEELLGNEVECLARATEQSPGGTIFKVDGESESLESFFFAAVALHRSANITGAAAA